MPRPNESLQKILDAAGQEFSLRGYHLTSMEDIAKSAGVAKGTLYYNFPTKATLFKSVVADGMDYLIAEVKKTVDSNIPASEQMEKIVRLHIKTFSQYPHIVRIMFHEISGGLDIEIREYVEDLRARYVSFFISLLDIAVHEGLIKDLDRHLLANTLMDMIYSASSYLVDHPDSCSEDSVYEFVDEVLFSGIFIHRSYSENEG